MIGNTLLQHLLHTQRLILSTGSGETTDPSQQRNWHEDQICRVVWRKYTQGRYEANPGILPGYSFCLRIEEEMILQTLTLITSVLAVH